MKIRQHKGGLADSLATMQTIEPTMTAIREYMMARPAYFPFTEKELATVQVKECLSSSSVDTRIPGWGYTYMVTYIPEGKDAAFPFGMCNEMVRPEA
jgi:hypothetical protein